MKKTTFILSLFILFLSLSPCSDTNLQHEAINEFSIEHQNDKEDLCPITCSCNCCGMSVTYESLAPFLLKEHLKISTQVSLKYDSHYRFDFFSSIWQPPQLIS